MQILEVKDDIAKIEYNPAENKFLPSDFLLIEDFTQKYIAQILDIKTTEHSNVNIAISRLVLNIDKEDNLAYFNGCSPSETSKVIYVTPDEITELIKDSEENIYWGNLSNHLSCYVKTSKSFVDDKLYIQSDNTDKTQIIFNNLITELKDKNKKILIVDFDGTYSACEDVFKLKISENIKMPLNINAFDTIWENDIKDCTKEDKAVVQNIIFELKEYLQTIPSKSIPFNLFKQVVDSEYNSNPISGLMLLRKKLWLYSQEEIFANSKEQYDVLNLALSHNNVVIVDASILSEFWYDFVIQTIAELTDFNTYLFLPLNNSQINERTISFLYGKQNIFPIFATTYTNACRQLLKSLSNNQLLSKPSCFLQENENYSFLIEKIDESDFVLYGEATLQLPLQLKLQPFTNSTADDVVQNDIKKDVDKLLSSSQPLISQNANIIDSENDSQEEFYDEIVEEQNEIIEEDIDDITDFDFDFLDEMESSNTQNEPEEIIEQIDEENQAYNLDEPLNEYENIQENDAIDTNMENSEENPQESFEQVDDSDEIVSIDEVIENIETKAQEVDEEVEEQKQPERPEINEHINTNEEQNIPIYETDNSSHISVENLPFKVNDRVYHPKYGQGVIQSFIHYSNNILFSLIDFDDVGRRILDPRVSGIEKI